MQNFKDFLNTVKTIKLQKNKTENVQDKYLNHEILPKKTLLFYSILKAHQMSKKKDTIFYNQFLKCDKKLNYRKRLQRKHIILCNKTRDVTIMSARDEIHHKMR